MSNNNNNNDILRCTTKAFFMDLKTKTGIETGKKVVHFGKLLTRPHHSADWRMVKWEQIMRIPASITTKNDYLCGGLLFDSAVEFLKVKGVKIPEPDD